MAIDWQQADSVFRLLAAAYAALGEEAFRGRFGDIALLYGRDATYDAIKSEWKKVAKLANLLQARHPDHRPIAGLARPRLEARPPRRPARNPKEESFVSITIKDGDEIDDFKADVQVRRSPSKVQNASSYKKRPRPAADAIIGQGSRQVKRAHLDFALPHGNDAIDVNDGQDVAARTGHWWSATDEAGPLLEHTNPHAPVTPRKMTNLLRPCIVAASCNEELVESQRRSDTIRPGNGTLRQRDNFAFPFLSKHRSDGRAVLQSQDIDWSFRTPSVEAGPSRSFIRPQSNEEHTKQTQDAQTPEVVDLVSSDGEIVEQVDLQPSPSGRRKNKGKGKMARIPPTPFAVERLYVDSDKLVCYLCSRRYQTGAALREHEHSGSHKHLLSDPSRVERAKRRVARYVRGDSLFDRIDAVLREIHPDPPTGEAQTRQPTIIRGVDRHIVTLSPEADDEEVMQVSGANVGNGPPVSRTVIAPVRRRRRRQANPLPVVGAASNPTERFGHDIRSSDQLARTLRETVFEATAAVSVAVRAMRLAGLHPDSQMPELLAEPPPQWSSTPVQPADTVRLQRRNGLPNIWATDAEFMQFPAVAQSASLPAMPATIIALSATVTNLLTGEEIINHRLELPVPLEDVECRLKAWKRAPWQVRRQFCNHYIRECPLPIIESRELAERMLAAGLSKDDYIFSWHLGFTDYNVLHEFLSRSNSAHHLPPLQNLIRPIYAWRQLLPGLPSGHGLQKLFEFVFPNSALNYSHHFADVDTKKLGIMSWKLLGLKYRPRSTTA